MTKTVRFTGIRLDNGELVESCSLITLKQSGLCFIGEGDKPIECYLDENGNLTDVMNTCFYRVDPEMIEVTFVEDDSI